MNLQTVNLYPLTVGEILDRAFRLYRTNFWLLIGIAGVILAPFLCLEIVSWIVIQDTSIVSLTEGVLTTNLLVGALIWAASCVYMGDTVSLNGAYKVALHRFWPMFRANFLQGLAYVPIGLAFGLISMAGSGCLAVLIPIVIIYIAYFATRWSVATTTVVIETLDGSSGLKRSWLLTAKDFKHILGTVFVAGLLVYLLGSLPSVIINFALVRFGDTLQIGHVLSLVIAQLGSLLSLPFSAVSIVILYYDLRVRREGYDLELALQDEKDKESDSPDEQI